MLSVVEPGVVASVAPGKAVSVVRGDDVVVGIKHQPRSKDGPQARRLLALAAIYDGSSCSEALIGGVTIQIVRNWVRETMRFLLAAAALMLTCQAAGAETLRCEMTTFELKNNSVVTIDEPRLNYHHDGSYDRLRGKIIVQTKRADNMITGQS